MPHTALNDLQQQIKQQQNKTDRETVSLENTIRETCESGVFYDCCEVGSISWTYACIRDATGMKVGGHDIAISKSKGSC